MSSPEPADGLYCAGGYGSATAASLLRSRGFTTVADLLGGCPESTGTERAAIAADARS